MHHDTWEEYASIQEQTGNVQLRRQYQMKMQGMVMTRLTEVQMGGLPESYCQDSGGKKAPGKLEPAGPHPTLIFKKHHPFLTDNFHCLNHTLGAFWSDIPFHAPLTRSVSSETSPSPLDS